MRIKTQMIGMDLDGTLLTTEKKLTPYTQDVLKRAIAQGIIVLPATGRPVSGIPEEIMHFPGIRYAVTANGGRIVDVQENRTIYENLVPVDKAYAILSVFEKYDTLREIYYDGIGYSEETMLKNIHRYIEPGPMADYMVATRRPVPDVHAKFIETNRPVDKVQGIFASLADKDEALKELEKITDIEITGALSQNVEINAKDVDKGNALLRLGQILGIPGEEIMAFGDGTNDRKMLEKVGTGVAMANGVPEVKAAADYITTSNDEEGVARFIEKYVLD
ncbi:HAD family hydrolase [Faecalicatena contorta]|uniref:HAD family hydrolase n=1 Tax=Faecalicatena contorta TaxID=39482 RepID=UPI001F307814|nr:HAD family hydrolase [Faecalicatena contorta]MCF2684153.1 HAD family hydrolase [Faecalicatena contorta]